MNPKKQAIRAEAVLKNSLLSLQTVPLSKKYKFESIDVRKDGQHLTYLRCSTCGTTFRKDQYMKCPSCGEEVQTETTYSFSKKETVVPAILPICKERTFQALVVAGYDIRAEKVEMIHFRCWMEKLSEITPEQAMQLSAQQDARLWRHEGKKRVLSMFEGWIVSDSHQVYTSEWPNQMKTHRLSSMNDLNCFSSDVWLPKILGDSEVLDLMRRHHYPVDEGPETLLRFLMERADGKRVSSSRTEKELCKKKRAEEERMEEIALAHAFSSGHLNKMASHYHCDSIVSNDGYWSEEKGARVSNLIWCPCDGAVHHLKDPIVLNASAVRCPVCGQTHQLSWANREDNIKMRVTGELAEDGTMLVHLTEWKTVPSASEFEKLPDGSLFFPKTRLNCYFVCVLGKYSYEIYFVFNVECGELLPSKAGIDRHMSYLSEQCVEFDNDLEQVLSQSNASWLPLREIAQSEPGDASKTLWKLLCSKSTLSNEFSAGARSDAFSGLLNSLYEKPTLVRLAKAGFSKFLLNHHQELAVWVKEETSIAEMLGISESVLTRLPMPDADDNGDASLDCLSELLSVFDNISQDTLLRLHQTLSKSPRWPSWADLSLLKNCDPGRLIDYLDGKSAVSYFAFLSSLSGMGIQPSSESEWFPSDLENAAHWTSVCCKALENWSEGWGTEFPLLSDAFALKTEKCGDVEVLPCWDPALFIWDLIQIPHWSAPEELAQACRFVEKDLQRFPYAPILKAVQNEQTVGLAYIDLEKEVSGIEFKICFFTKDRNSCSPSALSVFEDYAKRYGLTVAHD